MRHPLADPCPRLVTSNARNPFGNGKLFFVRVEMDLLFKERIFAKLTNAPQSLSGLFGVAAPMSEHHLSCSVERHNLQSEILAT